MIDAVDLVFIVAGVETRRRFMIPPGGPHLGAVLSPEVEPRNPDERDPGWPGLAERLAAAVPAAVLLAQPAPSYSHGGLVAELRAGGRAVRGDPACGGPVAMVGYGLGAAAALVAASTEARVVGVAALGAPADLPRAGYGTERHLEQLRRAGLADPADSAAWRREFIALSPVRSLAKLNGRPVLVVHGAGDDRVPVTDGEAIAAATGGELTTLPAAGHSLRRDEAAFERVVAFLRRLKPA